MHPIFWVLLFAFVPCSIPIRLRSPTLPECSALQLLGEGYTFEPLGSASTCDFHLAQLKRLSHSPENFSLKCTNSNASPHNPFQWQSLERQQLLMHPLRGGGGALGGREVKVKAVKKKHVGSAPKTKNEGELKADGLTRSQRRKAKDDAKATRSAANADDSPMSGLQEAAEIAARALKKSAQATRSTRPSLALLGENSDEDEIHMKLAQRGVAGLSISSQQRDDEPESDSETSSAEAETNNKRGGMSAPLESSQSSKAVAQVDLDERVEAVLSECGLSRHLQLFKRERVSWDALLELEEADLVSLGLTLGERKVLLRTVRQANAKAPSDDPRPPPPAVQPVPSRPAGGQGARGQGGGSKKNKAVQTDIEVDSDQQVGQHNDEYEELSEPPAVSRPPAGAGAKGRKADRRLAAAKRAAAAAQDSDQDSGGGGGGKESDDDGKVFTARLQQQGGKKAAQPAPAKAKPAVEPAQPGPPHAQGAAGKGQGGAGKGQAGKGPAGKGQGAAGNGQGGQVQGGAGKAAAGRMQAGGAKAAAAAAAAESANEAAAAGEAAAGSQAAAQRGGRKAVNKVSAIPPPGEALNKAAATPAPAAVGAAVRREQQARPPQTKGKGKAAEAAASAAAAAKAGSGSRAEGGGEEEEEESSSGSADAVGGGAGAAEALEDERLGKFSLSQAGKGGGGKGRQVTGGRTDVVIEGFSINVGGKELFKDADLKIAAGRRYGLVGPNGQGKSTLLLHIARKALAIPQDLDVQLLEQEVPADDTPAIAMVLAADRVSAALHAERRKLEKSGGGGGAEESERLRAVYAELDARGDRSAEARARAILFGLGFPQDWQDKATRTFSGGWRMRLSLARALFIEPSLLLLDEPTNHLDLNAVLWLAEYLSGWKKTILVVSHDVAFLNSVCTDIVHVDQQKLFYYKGGYDAFRESFAAQRAEQARAWEKQQKQLKAMKGKGQSRQAADAALTKKIAREKGSADAGLTRRPKEYEVKFTFPEPPALSPPILQLNDVSFSYPGGPQIFDQVNLGVWMDSRVAVVGPNGCGKSTLLQLLTGHLTASSGEIRRNPSLRIGRYSQHFVDSLPETGSAVDYLQRLGREHKNPSFEVVQQCRAQLGRYGLEGHAHTIGLRDLSGGQKARVVFAGLAIARPHLLLFDEPTNHLDIESIEALAQAISEYQGGVVLVSHDARLIRTAIDSHVQGQLWLVEGGGVRVLEGGMDAYRDHVLSGLNTTRPGASLVQAAAAPAQAAPAGELSQDGGEGESDSEDDTEGEGSGSHDQGASGSSAGDSDRENDSDGAGKEASSSRQIDSKDSGSG